MPLICEVGGSGLILPLFGDAEQQWNKSLRVVLYLLGLLWTFMGVAIVADIFMAAIEQITSKTRPITTVGKDGVSKTVYVQVWNGTVANLTLMALGSSAPEILLSVIELVSNNYFSGDLGPSTIVGSAAFNLMVILAACVMAIPTGEVRTIDQIGVFYVTAFFSIAAYMWLVYILMVATPDMVTRAEGSITFVLFPVLVVIAYLVDIGFFSRKNTLLSGAHGFLRGGTSTLSEAEMSKIVAEIRARFPNETLTKEVLAELVAAEAGRRAHKSRAYWRVQATRQMMGGRRVIQAKSVRLADQPTLVLHGGKPGSYASDLEPAVLTFSAGGKYSVKENDRAVTVTVLRTGNLDCSVGVHYTTIDGTARAGADYKPEKGTLIFERREQAKEIKVVIIDDDESELDEHFFVKLTKYYVVQQGRGPHPPVGMQNSLATITVYDDDTGGVFQFEQQEVRVKDTDEKVTVRVLRREGNKGRAHVDYFTSDGKAISQYDYQAVNGRLWFQEGEIVKDIHIPIVPTSVYDDKEEHFFVHLTNPSNGAHLEKGHNGRPQDKVTATVVIVNDTDLRKDVDAIADIMPAINTDKLALGTSQWAEQFQDAVTVRSEDGTSPPNIADYLGHLVALPWKVLFAFCPPTLLCDGIACFVVALALIGVVTAIIGDLAGLLGCTLGIPDAITAITFVALGTSLPDTFASIASAKAEPSADSSIGNVTGSNSVNVFLGLGLPWTIGAFYWTVMGATPEWQARYPDLAEIYPEGGFAVPAGDLGYSVSVFSACAIVTIAIMLLRRRALKAELGGPPVWKYVTSVIFVLLWLAYVGLSAMKSLALI